MKTILKKVSKAAALVLVATVLTTGLSSCSKEGEPGPAGTAGTNGKDGNANVKSQTNTNLTWTFNNATKQFETNISDAQITQDIVDKGAVLVYLQEGGTNSQLPTSTMYDAQVVVFLDFEYSVGNVKITFMNSDLDNLLVPQSTMKFKIVAMAASARAANPGQVKYETIQTNYNLAE